ncbi:MAG: PIN domain-containing protein [Candidatus Aenigmarchaeota archaeon]|nr:PIN domain-containing protein [Candidatus Aenigmarchaeota archaeon]
MLLVVDTNILVSFFNEKSKARDLATSSFSELLSPNFALYEINAHKQEISEKFSISDEQFVFALKLMNTVIQFVRAEEYRRFFSRAKKVSPDIDDIDFFALALKAGAAIWSNDKKLKKQPAVRVFSTEDLVKLLGL